MTKDADVRKTNSDLTVATFNMAIDSYGKEKRTDYPRVTVFGRQAEVIEKYTGKGSLILIEGRIQTGSYEKNGQRVYTTDVIAEKVELLSKGTKIDEKSNQSLSGASQNQRETEVFSGFDEIDSESLPF